MRIANIDPLGEIATTLLREAAAEVRPLYAKAGEESLPAPRNDPLGSRDLYVAAFLGGLPVACGSLREHDRTTAELRRMYVRRAHRREQIGLAILRHLIAGAPALGYERIILETGNEQAPAIALYENCGFREIAPFGKYTFDETSRCFELRIDTV